MYLLDVCVLDSLGSITSPVGNSLGIDVQARSDKSFGSGLTAIRAGDG